MAANGGKHSIFDDGKRILIVEPIWTGIAPGRLDVLGGVADYSGSLVLQTPIEATTRVRIAASPQAVIRAQSEDKRFEMPLTQASTLRDANAMLVRARLDDLRVPLWARYPLGCLLLFSRAAQWWPEHGLSLEIESDVPLSMGVSSSAALEIATLRALEAMSGYPLDATRRARLAQQAENEIVGAPCGLMDQLASVYGVRGALLPILCRPDIVFDAVALPAWAVVAGWPSGVKHAVADSPYAVARASAFMGKKLLEAHFKRPLHHLTEISPSQLRGTSESVLPYHMMGREWLERFDHLDDEFSTVEKARLYPLRDGASFPIEENFRCELAMRLLGSTQNDKSNHDKSNHGKPKDDNAHAKPQDDVALQERSSHKNFSDFSSQEPALRALGELMFQSHAGYSTIGLGSRETDAMVEAARRMGPQNGIYGARVSGGGSGGTVVVLLRRDALSTLESLRERFQTPDLIF